MSREVSDNKSVVEKSRGGSQETLVVPCASIVIQERRASGYIGSAIRSSSDDFVVGLVVVSMSIHLFPFIQNSSNGSGSGFVGNGDCSDDNYNDGSFASDSEGGNTYARGDSSGGSGGSGGDNSGSHHGGRNGDAHNKSSGNDKNTSSKNSDSTGSSNVSSSHTKESSGGTCHINFTVAIVVAFLWAMMAAVTAAVSLVMSRVMVVIIVALVAISFIERLCSMKEGCIYLHPSIT